MENKDKIFLSRAVKVAMEGMEKGGGPFGAVIVCNGKIVAEAFNKVVLSHDPTAHAEIIAIREACSKLGSHDLSDCTLYTSCEPCPMCLGAIYWSGIKQVFFASDRNDAGKSGFSDKLIYDEIALDPAARKVSFIRIDDTGGKEVFRKWDRLEGKIPY
ncbi:MAG: nucleoside deaminase [Chloroflexota bacterium]